MINYFYTTITIGQAADSTFIAQALENGYQLEADENSESWMYYDEDAESWYEIVIEDGKVTMMYSYK